MSLQRTKDFSDAEPGRFHRKILLGGILGQYTNGYILGSITIPLITASATLGLTSLWTGLIAAGALPGIITGNLVFGPLADRFGRKHIYALAPYALFVMSVMQLFITTAEGLLAVRFILGIAIGADYAAGLTMMSEWAPSKHREHVLSFVLVSWVIGYVSAYMVGSAIQYIDAELWRVTLASCALPALATLVARRHIPESPRWLALHDRIVEARAIVTIRLGKGYTVATPDNQPKNKQRMSIFCSTHRRNLFVGSIFLACQSIPYYGISLFLPSILLDIGIADSYMVGLFFYLLLVIGVICGTWLINQITRRFFLVSSFYLCAVSLLLTVVFINTYPILGICTLFIFSLIMSAALVLQFVYPSELFPTELRASGVGFVMGMGQVGSVTGTIVFPVIMASLNTHYVLGFCIATLLIGGCICHKLAPETQSRA